jgi:hypothetical protein
MIHGVDLQLKQHNKYHLSIVCSIKLRVFVNIILDSKAKEHSNNYRVVLLLEQA